jgi:hypothetical protein
MRQKMRNPAAGDGRARGTATRNDSSYFRVPLQRLQVLTEHLHSLGPRALHEFLLEVIAAPGGDVVERLEVYRRLDPAVVRAVGGDQFPPAPLHLVSR